MLSRSASLSWMPAASGSRYSSSPLVGSVAMIGLARIPTDGATAKLLEQMQSDRTSSMLFSVPETVARLSAICPLLPGDLIFTGTPAGVGAVVRGDRLTGTIAGVGTVETTLA